MRRPAGDDGTVLVLLLGLTAVLLSCLVVVVDVSQVVLARRDVGSVADGAAAAAAQDVDAAAVRRSGVGAAPPLDAAAVAQTVARYATGTTQVTAALAPNDPTTVRVTARRSVRLAFVGWLGVGSEVQVSATSAARSPAG